MQNQNIKLLYSFSKAWKHEAFKSMRRLPLDIRKRHSANNMYVKLYYVDEISYHNNVIVFFRRMPFSFLRCSSSPFLLSFCASFIPNDKTSKTEKRRLKPFKTNSLSHSISIFYLFKQKYVCFLSSIFCQVNRNDCVPNLVSV